MPAAFGALELLAIALFMFVYAFLYATKWSLTPLVSALHSSLGWIPFVGNVVDRVDNAVIAALNTAIVHTEAGIVTLWHGIVWSFDETLLGLEYFTKQVDDALGHMVSSTIHTIAKAEEKAYTFARNEIVGRISDATTTAEKAAVKYADAAIAVASKGFTRALTKTEAALRSEIATAKHDAISAANQAVATLRGAEEAAVARARSIGQSALDEITQTVKPGITAAEADARSALAQLAAAGELTADEVLHLPGLALDDLEKLAQGIDWKKLAGIAGAVPLVYAIVRALEAETGLGRAECRGKVKQICNTNPSKWLHMLEGLAALGLVLDFEAMVREANRIAPHVRTLIEEVEPKKYRTAA